MESKDLQPIGYLEKDKNKFIYFKTDIISFLKTKYTNNEVDHIYEKYWLNNENIIIISNNSDYHCFETQEINEIITTILKQQKELKNL